MEVLRIGVCHEGWQCLTDDDACSVEAEAASFPLSDAPRLDQRELAGDYIVFDLSAVPVEETDSVTGAKCLSSDGMVWSDDPFHSFLSHTGGGGLQYVDLSMVLVQKPYIEFLVLFRCLQARRTCSWCTTRRRRRSVGAPLQRGLPTAPRFGSPAACCCSCTCCRRCECVTRLTADHSNALQISGYLVRVSIRLCACSTLLLIYCDA